MSVGMISAADHQLAVIVLEVLTGLACVYALARWRRPVAMDPPGYGKQYALAFGLLLIAEAAGHILLARGLAWRHPFLFSIGAAIPLFPVIALIANAERKRTLAARKRRGMSP